MSFSWPPTLVSEIAERRCIVILGAGASAGCTSADGKKSPPGWEALLHNAIELLPDDSSKRYAKGLVKKQQYLDAAEVIRRGVNRADFGNFMREEFHVPRYGPSEIHKQVLDLDPKIVITTNYDDAYETYCRQGSAAPAYNVCRYYETHALNDIRSTMRVILKAHGCVSDPTKIVLTRTDYFEARRRYAPFYAVLDALFLTSTLLFVGCGLRDPDLQLLLENANIKAQVAHPHYAVVERGRHSAEVASFKDVHNLELLTYPRGKHSRVPAELADLAAQVVAWRRDHP